MAAFNLNYARKAALLEKDIEKRVGDYGRKLGIENRKYKTIAIRGAPDRIYFTADGRVFWVEYKRDKNSKLSANQVDEIAMMRAHGLDVFVCHDVDDGKHIMEIMA